MNVIFEKDLLQILRVQPELEAFSSAHGLAIEKPLTGDYLQGVAFIGAPGAIRTHGL